MEKIICGIYKITNPKNRVYIGQSIDINKRFRAYSNLQCERQCKLYNSLKKYGWENHKKEIVYICESDKLNELEIYFITLFNSIKNGLNLRYGGGSKAKHSLESIEKMKKPRPKPRPPISVETRLKLSIAGKNRILTEEHKRKISEAHKGKSKSKEHVLKFLETQKNNRIGKIHFNSGKKHSEDCRQKMRDAWVIRKERENSIKLPPKDK